MVLFVNACTCHELRARRLVEALLGKITDDYKEIKLDGVKFPVNVEAIMEEAMI